MLAATACDPGTKAPGGEEITILLSAPLSVSPWVGEWVVRGAKLAVDELNADGGVKVGDAKRRIRLVERDHANSVQRAQDNAREAVATNAAALITDGVGAVAVAGVTDPAHLPVFVTFEGGEGLIDENARPTLFRMAPANRPMANRLTDYLAERKPKLALLTDDSGYGRDGRTDVLAAIKRNKMTLVSSAELATGADPAPQVLKAQQSGADTVLLWARAPMTASVIASMRGREWKAPVWTGPAAEDPLVRQQVAQHPEWLDGVGFVSFRMTAEIGPEPFGRFRAAYEKAYGADAIGVTAGGKEVVQPPDWAMYPYDSVKLVAQALFIAKGTGQALMNALHDVSITGANGDERSFLPRNHEGVSSDDMYIATFSEMRYTPVKDDFLSASLPLVPQ
jgi:ABC-type branched-subunit amino acid transport system substrate-binding protein